MLACFLYALFNSLGYVVLIQNAWIPNLCRISTQLKGSTSYFIDIFWLFPLSIFSYSIDLNVLNEVQQRKRCRISACNITIKCVMYCSCSGSWILQINFIKQCDTNVGRLLNRRICGRVMFYDWRKAAQERWGSRPLTFFNCSWTCPG